MERVHIRFLWLEKSVEPSSNGCRIKNPLLNCIYNTTGMMHLKITLWNTLRVGERLSHAQVAVASLVTRFLCSVKGARSWRINVFFMIQTVVFCEVYAEDEETAEHRLYNKTQQSDLTVI